MRKIILILLAALLLFAAGAALAEEPAAAPAEVPVGEAEVPAEEPAIVPEEVPAEEPGPEPAEVPAEEPVTEPAEAPAEEPAQEPVEEPAEEPAQETAEEPAEEPAQETAEEPAEEPAQETAEEPAQEPAQETAEEPAEKPAEEPEWVPEAGICAHANTKTEYYFDAPVYRPVNSASHAVDGKAVVTVICLDCGAVLSSEAEDNAQEISPHVFRGNRCVLCGWEAPVAKETAAPAVREAVISLSAMDDGGQYACTLTGQDLEEADTLVLRPDGRDTALVVETEMFREEISRTGGRVTAEIGNADGQNIYAAFRMYGADGEEIDPDMCGIYLRIYAEKRDTPYNVSFTGQKGDVVWEEARWVAEEEDKGYWTIPWRGNGMYEYK